MNQYFPSRKGPVIGVIIWGIIFYVLYLSVRSLHNNFQWSTFLVFATVFIPLLLFIGTVWFKTGYIIDGKILSIKIGPVVLGRIPIRQIYSVQRTWLVLSAPANSLKRMIITYSDGHAVISPAREKEFIILLQTINPSIKSEIRNK